MNLQDVRFSNGNTLMVENFGNEVNTFSAVPNPMDVNTTIHFTANQTETLQFMVYNQLGKVVFKTNFNSVIGKNQIPFNRQNLAAGLYFCKIESAFVNYKTTKLLIK